MGNLYGLLLDSLAEVREVDVRIGRLFTIDPERAGLERVRQKAYATIGYLMVSGAEGAALVAMPYPDRKPAAAPAKKQPRKLKTGRKVH